MGLRASDGGVQLLLLFSLLHFWFSPRYLLCLFELKSISGLRTRPRSTGIRVQLTLPFLPPSVSRCEVEVGQPAQVNSRTEKGVVVHCGGGHLLICCSITHFHLLFTWIGSRTTNISLWYSILILIRYSCSIRNVFSLKYQLKVILDSINH